LAENDASHALAIRRNPHIRAPIPNAGLNRKVPNPTMQCHARCQQSQQDSHRNRNVRSL
jgi:hypothetical protein